MNQFKPYFLGLKKDVRRATSCQKCLRTGDLERVGKTAYHHTFFEMLGNFSFGDYFKEEAIAWGWEFVTKELNFPKDRLWVSVFEEDDEAFEIWKRKIGVSENRIVRMGPMDNFWPANAKADGPNGPCGPCSEIYVGETAGKGVEIWNLVFTQFDRQQDATLKPLPQRNIDTGMGLERTAAVLQGVESNFDIDSFRRIREALKGLTLRGPANSDEKRVRAHENAVMDHIRAVVFSIADGALPSNEGRGYVIRKLIRLGNEHFQKAGAAKPDSFHKLVSVIVDVMKAGYPELTQKEKTVTAIVENEERAYLEVIQVRLPKLHSELRALRSKHLDNDRLAPATSEIAFKYYDTYGLPLDAIADALKQNLGIDLDQRRFDELLESQRRRSRESSKISGEIFVKEGGLYEAVEDITRTEFLGYHEVEAKGVLLRLVRGQEKVKELLKDEEGLLIFDKTPFYAEQGGQVGDTGQITAPGFRAIVLDTQYAEKAIAHKIRVEEGKAVEGGTYHLKIDAERRSDIMKNHTATHLLHSALRKVLGEHVKQAGSLVAPDRLRFDFTHFKQMDPESISRVETIVNGEIQKNTALDKKIVSKERALQEGAIAFFGEKYEDEVRVVTIGDFSKELCGGTHLHSTGEIELFKILSESSIQAGVRRIEAVTGRKARQVLEESEREFNRLADEFGAAPDDIRNVLAERRKSVEMIKTALLSRALSRLRRDFQTFLEAAPEVKGVAVFVRREIHANPELFQKVAEGIRQSAQKPFVALWRCETADKVTFVVAATPELVQKGFQAGKIIKDISAIVEGSGGGRPDFAVGGGKNIAKADDAMKAGDLQIRDFIGSYF
jgi:alanyl-tRNA synthetase